VLVFTALVFVCLRGYVRIYQHQRPTLSDSFVLVAWLAFASCCACNIRLNRLGFYSTSRTYNQPLITINEDPELTIQALKVSFPIGTPGNLRLHLALLPMSMARKGCVTCLLLSNHSYYAKGTSSSSGSSRWICRCNVYRGDGIKRILLQTHLIQLVPVTSDWLMSRSLTTENQCINCSAYSVFFPSAMSNIFIDLLSNLSTSQKANPVFIFPFFLIRKLQIARQQRWRLVFLFSLGGIAILLSFVRLIAIAVSARTAQVAVWTALECSTAIVVACCPALRPLLRRSTTVSSDRPMNRPRLRTNDSRKKDSSTINTESVKDKDFDGEASRFN
jgi:hypothetical protein